MAYDEAKALEYYERELGRGLAPERILRRFLSQQGLPQSSAGELRVALDAKIAQRKGGVVVALPDAAEIPAVLLHLIPPAEPAPIFPPPPPTPSAEPPQVAPLPAPVEATPPSAPSQTTQEPAMAVVASLVPALVTAARGQIEDILDQVVPTLLQRAGASDALVSLVLGEFEGAITKAGRLVRRNSPDRDEKIAALKSITVDAIQDILDEDGLTEAEVRQAVAAFLAAAFDAAVDPRALETVDDGPIRSAFEWLAEKGQDLLEVDQKKLLARAAHVERRANLLLQRAADLRARAATRS